ncbi:hypothetical protein [Methylomonas sp. UP202]|uniref:hypothetical protein n=1 Tax=Methylomonas sp. UP202 TaxID=3040943 RepID=UPI002479744B|nr:hypothetical protein [Methylomonas sp. UP202]WGS84976.1 hypothetical protein QC632_18255 [Methylomonas sp. UP202]
MKTTVIANVRMVQKYDTDTTKGVNVFCEDENDGLNENLIGPVQLVIGGNLDHFEAFKAYEKEGFLPGQFELSVDVTRGSGGKAKLVLINIKDPRLAGINRVYEQRPDPAQPSPSTNTYTAAKPDTAGQSQPNSSAAPKADAPVSKG